jgi:hypothetical protein
MLIRPVVQITAAIAAMLFALAAALSWKRISIGHARKAIALPGVLLLGYCALPGICFAVDGATRKLYWNRPIVNPSLVDQILLWIPLGEFMCFIFVPIAAIAGLGFLLAAGGRPLLFGIFSASLSVVSLICAS